MNDTEARAVQYEAALEYQKRGKSSVWFYWQHKDIDWKGIKQTARVKAFLAKKQLEPVKDEKSVDSAHFRLYLENTAS